MISKMKKRIFLDYAAGRNNPNAIYKEGREAHTRLEQARARISKVLSVAKDEIIFTPWGTEANVLILDINFFGARGTKWHAITTSIEHKSALDAFKKLEKSGVGVTCLKPDSDGFISPKQVQVALRKNTRLISIMYANNEIGTIQPIKEISRLLRVQTPKLKSKIIFHSDCVQAPGLLPINMQSLGVDMATFSAPKFGGPAGAAFAYVRRGTPVSDMRDAIPIELAEQMANKLEETLKLSKPDKLLKLANLRDYFIAGVLKNTRASLNGSQENRLANNANFVFEIDAELLVLELDRYGIAASAGAACSSRDCEEGSHVIIALGKSKDEANRSVRFSLGDETSKPELDYVIKVLVKIINKHTNIWQMK